MRGLMQDGLNLLNKNVRLSPVGKQNLCGNELITGSINTVW